MQNQVDFVIQNIKLKRFEKNICIKKRQKNSNVFIINVEVTKCKILVNKFVRSDPKNFQTNTVTGGKYR